MEKINETSPALIAFCKDAEKLAKKHGVQVDFSNFCWYYPTVKLSVMDVGLKETQGLFIRIYVYIKRKIARKHLC